MTDEDVRQVTEGAKDILRTRGDVFAEYILAYISKLEEENAELEEKLKNEIAFNEQSETVKRYKEQIKKMKNCGNCNGIVNGVRQEKCHFCMRSKLLSEWELAE